jgi:hypothetical protein
MKLCDPDLDRQLRAGVDRYEQLPAWVKEASAQRDTAHRPHEREEPSRVANAEELARR